MAAKNQIASASSTAGKFLNEILSIIIFSALDLADFILCYAFKVADFLIESEWKPCYCSSAKEAIAGSGKILVSEKGESRKIVDVRVSCSKLLLEEISDTLYTRPSFLSKITPSSKRVDRRSTFMVDSMIVEMLQGRIGRPGILPTPRWSDCDCKNCTSCRDTLFVKAHGGEDGVHEDVLFIHGFISSSSFWTETLYPNFSKSAKSKYRFLAVDLLGFGRSPKPNDSLYTLREHLDMIERSVLGPYKVKSFHIVAHSLGCILALALAVKHPASIRSLTLLAPPYFPAPKGELPAQYTMKRIAPRRVWPVITFGASIGCWYEHISRTACLVLSKNHRLWEFLTKLLTRNRMQTCLMEGFLRHTHKAAWHTLHNVICGSAAKVEGYLEQVKNEVNCSITLLHGTDDVLIPVECSRNIKSRIPRAQLRLLHRKDHLTILVGRHKAFAAELEHIWENSNI